MCGITGFKLLRPIQDPDAILIKMMDAIAHRGPDSEGTWSDANRGVYLGHRRLAIQDLSEAGQQPMTSPSGRYVIAYNGEIYNHNHLRTLLTKFGNTPTWRGSSDTETLLACIDEWGLQQTLTKANGMFAFVLWDNQQGSMFLARDRLGEKPLYYANVGDALVFGSELRTITSFPGFTPTIDRASLANYFRYSSVPPPQTIFADVYKLQPSTFIEITEGELATADQVKYWSVTDSSMNTRSTIPSYEEALHELNEQLQKSVVSRMISDVPLGAFLSGGFDSSLITAIMQKHSDTPVQTFSIGFSDVTYNEAPHAKRVADHLGTNHTEFYVEESDILKIVPNLSNIWDEPFADSSQIPTYLVSSLTREKVTVSLSGDGGDELFYGYGRYENNKNMWSRISRIPYPLRRLAKASSDAIPNQAFSFAPAWLRSKVRWLSELSPIYSSRSADELYWHMMCHFQEPGKLVRGYYVGEDERAFISSDFLDDFLDDNELGRNNHASRMMLRDLQNYLPNTILTKVDRASMAVGLEARAPLLDHDLVELAWSLPFEYKYKDGVNKRILKDILYTYIPRELVDRPKMGFAVPIADWLRGSLKGWASDLLSPELIERQGYLDAQQVQLMWKEHQDGIWDWRYSLWDILMFQSWLQQFQNAQLDELDGIK